MGLEQRSGLGKGPSGWRGDAQGKGGILQFMLRWGGAGGGVNVFLFLIKKIKNLN